MNTKMHADEIATDSAVVTRLLESQFPELAGAEVLPFPSSGSSNVLYRLGPSLLIRLPRIPKAAEQLRKEHVWLPKLAPTLPLPIPVPVALGAPGEGFPWNWAVYRFLEGSAASDASLANPASAALQLAAFVIALQRVSPGGGPAPGSHNSQRGAPLCQRDAAVRGAIASLGSEIDHAQAVAAWEAALAAPAWSGPPVWLHGDLIPDNLLNP